MSPIDLIHRLQNVLPKQLRGIVSISLGELAGDDEDKWMMGIVSIF